VNKEKIKNVYDYYAFGSHEPNRVFAKQRCATDYDTILGSSLANDSFDDVSISGSTAYSNFTWEIFGTANFNENCNNSNDFPDLVLCSNNLGGVETSFNGYTAGEVYHLQFDFFAWESTDCYYIDGSGCIDGAGVTIEIYDSSLALTHTQTLSTGTAQGFYFTAPSTSFKLRISYSNYYSSWKRCCLLIDNVILSQTTINNNTVCFKDKYRYGFNGQEKVDEIAGAGNHYTAKFWEYDPRIVQRWNVDPIIKYWESPYLINHGNPILYLDPDGADAKSRAEKYKKKNGGTLEKLPSGAWSVDKPIEGGVEAKVFRNNIFDKIGNGIVRALNSLDKFINNSKGNSYGENEDLIKSASFRVKEQLEFNKYQMKLESGLFSTSEFNGGMYFSLTFRTGIEASILTGETNASSFELKPSSSIGIGLNTKDEFSSYNGISSSEFIQIQGIGAMTGIPITLKNTTKISLKNNDVSNKTEFDINTSYSTKPDVKVGIFHEFKFQIGSGLINLQGRN